MSPSKGDHAMVSLSEIVRLTLVHWLDRRGLCMTSSSPDAIQVPPFMGFAHEEYVQAHLDRGKDESGLGWAPFYTCIANKKRVYVWAFDPSRKDPCCVMVSDHEAFPPGASVVELQNMFADQHRRQKLTRVSRTHHMQADAFLLQTFIHHITLGGNENRGSTP